MGNITLIIGGARSGKSKLALESAKKFKKVAFVATCQGLDAEMRGRIRAHRRNRPSAWKTYEEPRDLAAALEKICGHFDCVVIDCLTLWVSNMLLAGTAPKNIETQIERALDILKKKHQAAIIVSNEVGLGIVPNNKLSRGFRDIAGRVNQIAAARADEVFFTVAGLALKLK